MDTTIPAAASPLTHGLVTGPARPAVVLAAFPSAVYLGLEGRSAVLPIVASDALVLPTSLRLAVSGPVAWGVEPGDIVTVGGGMVTMARHGIRVVRTWRPRQVATGAPVPAAVDWAGLLADVGRGPGLTPRADDVLCGALLAARAFGVARPDELPLARTTSLSASLLVAAQGGYAVSCVVDHMDHVLAGSPDAEVSRSAVLAIGHTSGAGLLEGIELVTYCVNTVNTPLPERISL